MKDLVTSLYLPIFALTLVAFSPLRSSYAQTPPELTVDIQNTFYATGFMGDGKHGRRHIFFTEAHSDNPHSSPTSIKINYRFGPDRWAGIYWQNKSDNWGDRPGNNYEGKGLTRLTFWARSEMGGEVVEFKAGDIDDPDKPYRDSFSATLGRLPLTKEWKKYEIDLSTTKLSSVIGGFCWVASADSNTGETITFYLDDIILE